MKVLITFNCTNNIVVERLVEVNLNHEANLKSIKNAVEAITGKKNANVQVRPVWEGSLDNALEFITFLKNDQKVL